MYIEQRELVITIGSLSLQGRLDAASAPQLREVWRTYDERGINNVIVNMEQVEFIDSIGVSTLVSGMKGLRAKGGDLRIVALQPSARAIFELTMLDKVFEIFETENDALKGF
jgi:anti-sigma B factor antagonist